MNYNLINQVKNLIGILFAFVYAPAYAQVTVMNTTTSNGFSNNSGNGTVTFNFQNTNYYPVEITDIEGIVSSSASCVGEVWLKPTPVNGVPGAISAANGWSLAASGTFTGIANSTTLTTQPFITGTSIIIPAKATYGVAISGHTAALATAQRYFNMAAGSNAIISQGGCNLIMGDLISYGGGVPPAAPTNTPRGWLGKLTFRPYKIGNNNAGTAFQPISNFCSSNQNISVKIGNAGLNQINSLLVNWEIDQVAQSAISLSSLLDTIGGVHPSDTILALGNITFTNTQRVIKIWTSTPNTINDSEPNNDTIVYVLRPGLSGNYTIGNVAADFGSFRNAVQAIQQFGRCGPVTFNVLAGSQFVEDPILLTNVDSITFQKSGVGPNPMVVGINGIGTTDAVFRIRGCNQLVFDGIDVADSALNPNNTLRMEYGYAIINSSPTKGSSNNTIKNSRIVMQRINTASFGIIQSTSSAGGGVAATSLSGGNHNNLYQNIKISNVYKGIGLIGSPAFPDSNNIITSFNGDTTIIGADQPNDIGNGTALVYGISVADQKNVEVSNCLVRNLAHTSTSTCQGIFVDNASTSVSYGIARIWGNVVHSILRTTTTSATGTVHGIRIDVSNTTSALVYNNVVYNISSLSTPTTASANVIVRGISHGTSVGTGEASYFYNSVSINTPGLNASSAAFWKDKTGVVTLANNIFSNTSPPQTGVSKHYASFINANPTTVIASSSNNIFWVDNANGFLGFAITDRSTLMNYSANISATAPTDGHERGSAFANPNFIGTLNLDFNGPTAAAKSAVPIATILTDQRGNLRDTLNPTIGAYETLQALADSSAPIISNVVATGGLNPTVRCTITDNSDTTLAANTLLWYRPLSSTGAFLSLPPDSVPLNSINGIYKWSVSLDTLNWGNYEFYIAARDVKAPGVNIAVNPIQSTLSFAFGANDPVNYSLNPALFGSGAVPVRVFTKTSILAGGTYSVGTTGNFLNLTSVANMLNAAALTGNVVFELQPNYDGTTGETFPITFTKFQTIGGNWQATIRPSLGATNLMLSGTHTTSLINLNGVTNLTINGSAFGASTSVFAITNTSNTGSAIQFINNAQHNTIKNVSITGNSNLTTSGVVVFLNTTGTSAVDGNNNNLIDSCLINGNTNARNGVLALGSASPAENKNNTITNCHIIDFFSNVSGETANGIVINDGNTLWNIGTTGNGNYFYQTGARTPSSIPALTNAVNFKAIHINTATGSGFNIIDNRIGGNIPGIPSSTFVIGDNTTNVALTVRMIEINNVGSGLPVSIQGNIITGISVVSTTANFFSGIFCSTGRVNVGNIATNIVGSKNSLNAINLINRGTASLANIYGIRYAATSGIITNNEVGGFTVEQQQASGSSQFIGIYASGTITDSLSISNNLVGSLTVPHNIQVSASSLGGVNLFGLVASSASGAPVLFTNNTVTNLTVFSTISSINNTLKGIYVTGTSTVLTRISGNQVNRLICHSTNTSTGQNAALIGIGTLTSGGGRQDISNNTIHTLIAATPVVSAVNVDGVFYGSTSTATTNSITGNRIYTLYPNVLNALAIVDGINIAAGSNRVQVSNNMVALGFDSAGNSFTGNVAFSGINRTGGLATIVFNSVLVAGTGVASGIVNTFAFIRSSNAADSLYNNLFINIRANATTGGNHYAIGLNNTTGISINYNNYFATPLGAFNAVAQSGLSDWKLATAQDANSVSTAIQTVSNTDLHLTGSSIGNTTLGGVAIGNLSTDIDNQPRHMFPYMGADEIPASPLPVALLHFSGTYKANGNELRWETAQERNASHFDVEYSLDGKQFTRVAQVKATGNASGKSIYQYTHHILVDDNTTQYYRLKMVDHNQYWEYSQVISLTNRANMFHEVTLYPNPCNSEVMLKLHAASEQLLTIVIKDMTGKIISQSSSLVYQGLNEIALSEVEQLKPGIYYVLVAENVFKLVKQNE